MSGLARRAPGVVLAAALAGCGGASSSPDGNAGAGGAAGGGGAGVGAGGGGGGRDGGGGPGPGGSGGGSANDGGTIPPDLRAKLDAANAAWAGAKSGCPTYSYDRRWQSSFPGQPLRSTQVEVVADQTTRRRYSSGATVWIDGGSELRWTTVWDETGADVGSHAASGGPGIFQASTVEQLLSECAAVLVGNPAMYILQAEFNSQNGVPTLCTQRLMNCADDCTVGIELARFGCSPLPANGPTGN